MRQIIDRLAYDTTTAEIVHDSGEIQAPDDAVHDTACQRILYKTPNRRFFLCNKVKTLPNVQLMWDIEPISVEEAYKYLEKRECNEIIEEHFDIEEA